MYIIYYKNNHYGYSCTDLGAASRVLGVSKYTIKCWFVGGNTHKETDEYIICRGEHIKSNRRGIFGNGSDF